MTRAPLEIPCSELLAQLDAYLSYDLALARCLELGGHIDVCTSCAEHVARARAVKASDASGRTSEWKAFGDDGSGPS